MVRSSRPPFFPSALSRPWFAEWWDSLGCVWPYGGVWCVCVRVCVCRVRLGVGDLLVVLLELVEHRRGSQEGV
jgi:hypothetical protein